MAYSLRTLASYLSLFSSLLYLTPPRFPGLLATRGAPEKPESQNARISMNFEEFHRNLKEFQPRGTTVMKCYVKFLEFHVKFLEMPWHSWKFLRFGFRASPAPPAEGTCKGDMRGGFQRDFASRLGKGGGRGRSPKAKTPEFQ